MFSFFAFASYAVIACFTPGPNNIMSMTHAGRVGFAKSLRLLAGIATGFFLLLTACAFFSAALSQVIPIAMPYIRIAGALYLLYLAYKTVTDKGAHEERKNEASFLSGLLLQFVNPKTIVFGITIFSTFIVPYYSSALALLGFSALLAATGTAAIVSWALFGVVVTRFMERYQKAVNIAMGVLLVYCAVSLFL